MSTTYDTTEAVATAIQNTYLWNQIKTITGITTFTAANHISIVTRDEIMDILLSEPLNDHVHFLVKLPEITQGELDRYPCHNHILTYEVIALYQESDADQKNVQKIADYTINAIEAMITSGYAVKFDGCTFWRNKQAGNYICALVNFRIDQTNKITS